MVTETEISMFITEMGDAPSPLLLSMIMTEGRTEDTRGILIGTLTEKRETSKEKDQEIMRKTEHERETLREKEQETESLRRTVNEI